MQVKRRFHWEVAISSLVWLLGGAQAVAQNTGGASSHAPAAIPRWASATAPLVLRDVTVIDVQDGRRLPSQTVVIVGNRIRTLGPVRRVRIPPRAHVVDARGQYLMPGLWDLHAHPMTHALTAYPLFLANGVTGIRDASSSTPLDTLQRWRREILAGTRLGPPRQLLSGKAIDGVPLCEKAPDQAFAFHVCLDRADVRPYVDAMKAAGVDMLKLYWLTPELYFAIAAEARRVGVPFGGHAGAVLPTDASDSGARIIDHVRLFEAGYPTPLAFYTMCIDRRSASVEYCRSVATRLRRNGTWMVADVWPQGDTLTFGLRQRMREFWAGAPLAGTWLRRDSTRADADSVGRLQMVQRAGLPILAGTDVLGGTPDAREWWAGFSLHAVLAMYVAEGLTPLTALQSATLNPAKMLHGTDSLGTVAAGKLADLVLLDADPLVDIANTTTIRAVIADGRYFDRAGLDQILADVRATVRAERAPSP